jgi:hypothetical protein
MQVRERVQGGAVGPERDEGDTPRHRHHDVSGSERCGDGGLGGDQAGHLAGPSQHSQRSRRPDIRNVHRSD